MLDELRSESKRCLVLLASFVLVMPLGCSTPDLVETGQGEDVVRPAVPDTSGRTHARGRQWPLSQATKKRTEYKKAHFASFRPARFEAGDSETDPRARGPLFGLRGLELLALPSFAGNAAKPRDFAVTGSRVSQSSRGPFVGFSTLSYAQAESVAPDSTAVENEGTDYFDDIDNVDDLDLIDAAGADEIAREASNPLGRLWSLGNQFENKFLEGDLTDKTRYTHTWTFQPVIPVPLKDDWMLINRPAITTIFRAEVPTGPNSFETEEWELGDMALFSLLGKNIPQENEVLGDGDLVLGAGATFLFPTATEDRLGSERYSAGPAALAAYVGEKAIVGGLFQHRISYTGQSGRDEVNLTNLQYFYFLNFEGGWQVGGSPTIKANWEADSDDTWNVPIGLGVQKLLFLGKLPVKTGIHFEWSPIHEDTLGDRWSIKINLSLIIPALIEWPWLEGD